MAYYSEVLTVAKANQYVKELVTTLQQHLNKEHRIRVTEVVKGGSLGQGTAVPGNFDLDLVLYSQDIDPQRVAINGLKDILRMLKEFLIRHFGSNCQSLQLTDYAVSFTFYGEISVDLLPSPYWQKKRDLHDFLGQLGPFDRRRFSCSAAKWEKQFFQQEPPQVNEYIKRAKNWRNLVWPKKYSTDGRPKSILISVIMAEAYRRSNPKTLRNVEQEFKNIVKNHSAQRINMMRDVEQHRTPFIMDPANPYNNLYESGIGSYVAGSAEGTYAPGDGNWTGFKRHIDSLDLSKAV